MELSDIGTLPWISPVDRLALPGGSAIYFLLDGEGEPLYIGSTAYLKDRMGTNRWLKDGVNVGIERIAWMPCDWPAGEMLEAELIFKFKPRLNVRGKKVKLHPENTLWYRRPGWVVEQPPTAPQD